MGLVFLTLEADRWRALYQKPGGGTKIPRLSRRL